MVLTSWQTLEQREILNVAPSSPDAVVITGTAAGLPGLDDPYDPSGFDKLLDGQVLIDRVSTKMEDELLEKNIVRFVPHQDGAAELVDVQDREGVLHLAGRGRRVRLNERYGIAKGLVDKLDETSKWAIAGAIEALHDASLPLLPAFRTTSAGKTIRAGYKLPKSVGKRTGVVFGSAFPGYNRFAREVARYARGEQGEEAFSRNFVVEVLPFAHARIAAYLGALGPNVNVNAACASTTMAVTTAVDWIRAGRCDRVVLVGSDDVTSDELFPFVGGGFLASGAATIETDVNQAAVPFDKRRKGTILGMGAVGVVLERARDAEARGVTPIAEVLGTRVSNSAMYPMKLHPEHVAEQMDELLEEVEERFSLDRTEMANSTVFMSHETYSPGGPALAEAEALRRTFGHQSAEVLVANIKGFTGHAMGAGIEEFVALRALEQQVVPPVPNHKETDPALGPLRLSRGGHYPHLYSLRFAAGFGSQVALTLLRRVCNGESRIDETKLRQWVQEVTELSRVQLEMRKRHLVAVEDTTYDHLADSQLTPASKPLAHHRSL